MKMASVFLVTEISCEPKRQDSGYSNDAEALRAELYETKLKLLAAQLACENLALSVGASNSCFSRLDSTSQTNSCPNREDASNLLQEVQSTVELQTIRIKQVADCLLCSRLLVCLGKPSSASRAEDTPSDSRKVGHDEHNAQASTPASEEGELDELKVLIAASHNGDESSLGRVRGLKRIAEKTPKQERSAAQKFLLKTWRGPHLRELFVDASGHGIGVVSDVRRLAWTFVSSHPNLPKGPTGEVDMAWAELTAAEMGVRTLLATHRRHVPVTLRSDNQSVVKALKAHEWKKNTKLDGIVKDIFGLCDSAGLHLRPDWVSGKENPADKLTRVQGAYPPGGLAFPRRPLIPSHLSGLIEEVEDVA